MKPVINIDRSKPACQIAHQETVTAPKENPEQAFSQGVHSSPATLRIIPSFSFNEAKSETTALNKVNMKQNTNQEKEMLASALTLMRAKANFVHQFIRNPRKMGSITPSSAALCRTMCDTVNWDHSLRVAELGAGDGVLTRHILARMSPQAQLDVFEISPELVENLRGWSDPRMQVRACSAEYLSGEYDVIFSGLPLLSLPPQTREAILSAVHDVLGPRGVFVQFQYTSLTQPSLSRYFTWQRQRVLKNMPPAWVYRCTRHYAP